MSEEVKFDLNIAMDKYQRSLDNALKTTRAADKSVVGLKQSIDRASKSSIDIKTDASSVDRAAGKIRTLDGSTPEVEVVVDSAQIDEAQAEVNDLNGSTPNVEVQVDSSSVSEARSTVERSFMGIPLVFDVSNLPSAINGAINGVQNTLGVGSIVDANAAARQFESGILASNRALKDFEGYEGIFDRVVFSGLAENQQQLAGIALQAVDAGVSIGDLESVITTTLGVARLRGIDASEAFTILNTQVRTGLAGSFAEAGNVVAAAGTQLDNFNEGSEEFGAKLSAGGVSAAQALAVFNEATKAGVQNSGRLGEVFNELPNIINEAQNALKTGEDNPFLSALSDLGMASDSGALSAASTDTLGFINDVVSEVNAQIASGAITPLEGDALINAIFGSPAGEIGASVFRDIDFGAALAATVQPATLDTALAPLEDSLVNAARRAGAIIQTELGNNFELAGQPLVDLLDSLPERLNDFSDAVQSGKGLPEALEIALDAPGLSVDIRNLQGTIGGFVIDFQLGLASVLSAFGQGDAAGGLRQSATAGAERQLTFDLQYADTLSEVDQAFKDATRRGVSDAFQETAVTEAVSNIADEFGTKAADGFVRNLEALETGQSITAVFQEQSIWGSANPDMQGQRLELPVTLDAGETPEAAFKRLYPPEVLAGLLADADVFTAFTERFGAAATEGLETFILPESTAGLSTIAQETLDNYNKATVGVEEAGTAANVTTPLIAAFADEVVRAGNRVVALGDRASEFESAGTSAFETLDGNASTALDAMASNAELSASRQVTALELIQSAAIVTQGVLAAVGIDPAAFAAHVFNSNLGAGGGGNSTFDKALQPDGSHAAGLDRVPFDGYLAWLHKDEAVLPASEAAWYRNFSVPDLAVLGGGGGGNTTIINNTLNLNSTMNNASYAASMGAADSLSRQARGFF